MEVAVEVKVPSNLIVRPAGRGVKTCYNKTVTNSELDEIKNLAADNNRILRKLLGYQRRQFLWFVLRWVVVIGITLGTFYYLEPYLKPLIEIYQNLGMIAL